MAHEVFISHSSHDKKFAERLRKALQGHGVAAWIDHRALSAGDVLNEEIVQAIDRSEVFMVILTVNALNSSWVKKEVQCAQEKDLKIIPLLLGGELEPSAVQWIFCDELKCLTLLDDAGGLQGAMAALMAALGRTLPAYAPPVTPPAPAPVAELLLIISQPAMVDFAGKRQGVGKAKVVYVPSHGGVAVESNVFRRDGGESYGTGAQWCRRTAAAIQEGAVAQEKQGLELAHGEGLDFSNSVEVELLLERLAAG